MCWAVGLFQRPSSPPTYKGFFMASEITIKENHDIEYSGFRLQKNGLIPIGSPTFEQWEECGAFIKKAEGACHLWLGDWLNYGEERWGEEHAQALEADYGYDYDTLRRDKWVTKNVPVVRRRTNLSFDHHREVAKLEPKDQDILLDKAEEEHIPTKEFRQTVKDYVRTKERAALSLPDPVKYANKVIQGDCLIELGKIADQSIDMIYVDPPYNADKAEWDTFSWEEYWTFNNQWMNECRRILKLKHNLYINLPQNLLYDFVGRFGTPTTTLIWNYRNLVMGRDSNTKYLSTYQPILHYGGRQLNFNQDWSDERFDVQTIATPQSNFSDGKYHVAQKPLELLEWLVKTGSLPGELVLDPMAGSGTTGVACVKNNRDFILIEREDEHIQSIQQRLSTIA